MPTFQNPTGRTLSARRAASGSRARRGAGLWILEDDPYGELRYEDEPVPADRVAARRAATARCVLSSLSKVLAPGLRLGWARAPVALRARLAIAKQAVDLHTSTVDQAPRRYLARRASTSTRTSTACATCTASGATRCSPGCRARAAAGLVVEPAARRDVRVGAGCPRGTTPTALLARALEHDVAFVPGAPFFAGEPDHRTLRLSFVTHTRQEIAEGLRRLGAAAGGSASDVAGAPLDGAVAPG